MMYCLVYNTEGELVNMDARPYSFALDTPAIFTSVEVAEGFVNDWASRPDPSDSVRLFVRAISLGE